MKVSLAEGCRIQGRTELAAQWHPELNGSLTPDQVTAGSARKVWWQCPEGHTWRTAVCNRTNQYKRTGCPVCAGGTWTARGSCARSAGRACTPAKIMPE